MVSAGLALLAAATFLLVAVGLIAAGLLLGSRFEGPTAAEWRREAAGLAREVQQACETRAVHDVDADVGRRFLPLSSRLRSHARAAPASVDGRLVEQLHGLGTACHTLGVEYTPSTAARTGVFLEDRIEHLQADAGAFLDGIHEAGQEPG